MRFWILAFGLAACAPENEKTDDTGGDTQSADTQSTDTDDTADTGGDAGDYYCPQEMSLVYDADSTIAPFCIDTYEGQATGELGDVDQFIETVTVSTGTIASEREVLPTGLSFSQAVVLCEATPVTDVKGETVAYKRAATFQEWQDSGDGVLGQGGMLYPYGEERSESACHIPTSANELTVDELQPTGTAEECVSFFGVYDHIGNAWEWADSGLTADVEGWFENVEPETGWSIEKDDDDTLRIPVGWTEAKNVFTLSIAGLQPKQLYVQSDGRLTIPEDGLPSEEGASPAGYLSYELVFVYGDSGATATGYSLPVEFRMEKEQGYAVLYVRSEMDGVPVGLKVGGAWYTGAGSTLMPGTPAEVLNHPHDFAGTIAARCAADALMR